MRLASYFIEVAIPHIASFLPTDQIFAYLEKGEPVITKKKEFSVQELVVTKAELENLAENIHWEIDYDMYETRGMWGINLKTSQHKPWVQENYSMIAESDKALKMQGATCRHLTIGVAGQYIDTIRNTAQNSEVHLRAVWHAAVTLAHEVGHAIFGQDFRWNSVDGAEPWVGDMCWAELGFAMMDFVFSGYNPDTMNVESQAALFRRPLVWRKERKVAALERERPFYERFYAINNDYMEATLTQSFWDNIAKSTNNGVIKNGRTCLRPRISQHSAYADFPDFECPMGMAMYDEDEAPVEWKASKYPDRSPIPNTLDVLTPEEIAYAVRLSEQEESQNGQNGGNLSHIFDGDKDRDDDDEGDYDLARLKGKPKGLSSSVKSHPSSEEPIHLELYDPKRSIDLRGEDEFVELPVTYRQVATEGDVTSFRKRLHMGNGHEDRQHTKKFRREQIIEEDDDERDEVVAISVKTSTLRIGSRFTRLQADAYCKKHNIKSYRQMKFGQDWAAEHPIMEDPIDRDIIFPIRRHMLEEQAKSFNGGAEVLDVFRRAIAKRAWSYEDIIDFCCLQGLPFTGNERANELYEKVRGWYQINLDHRGSLYDAGTGHDKPELLISKVRDQHVKEEPIPNKDIQPKPVVWSVEERAYAAMKGLSKAKKAVISIRDLTSSPNPKLKPTTATGASAASKSKLTYFNVLANVSSQASALMKIRQQDLVDTGRGEGGLFKPRASKTLQPSAQQMLNAIEAVLKHQAATNLFNSINDDDRPRGCKRKRALKEKEDEGAIDSTGDDEETDDDGEDEVSHMAAIAKQVKKRRGRMGNTTSPPFPDSYFT
ncbi:hypothetical protein BGZ60DRAFT_414574 [Tricladium varicosporioides]|nr:hypothetical protein BGZ60DRAFT_414574 [Hymenoscyphus varicosporioides]